VGLRQLADGNGIHLEDATIQGFTSCC
jgi:hypothetical protein